MAVAMWSLLVVVLAPRLDPPPAAQLLPGSAAVDGSAAIGRLAAALRLKTISFGAGGPVASDAFRELHELLERTFPAVRAKLSREVVNDYSLLYTWAGSDPALPPILLMAHMDVVPVESGTEADWTHPPFAGVVDDKGTLWGRGALDDKLSVLGWLEAVERLSAPGFAPRRTIYLAFGHDEEIDGDRGAKAIAAALASRGVRLGFVLDEGSIIAEDMVPGLEKPLALIGVAEKGYLSLKLSAPGAGGHSSLPSQPMAISKLARAIVRLEDNPMTAEIRPPLSDLVHAISTNYGLLARTALRTRPLGGRYLVRAMEKTPETHAMIRTTAVPTVISGGEKDNVIPQEASAIFNFRILPGDSVARVVDHVKATVADPDIGISPVGVANEPSPIADSGSAGYRAIAETIAEIFPNAQVAPALVLAATDSRHFTGVADDVYRFLPIRLAPDQLSGMHGTNERISVDAYVDLIRFYVAFIQRAAR
jgi:carboxypeptidase PM20D1